MAEPQTTTCPQCSRLISPEDTIVVGHGRLAHLDCRRPRALSAEELTLLRIYCRDHPVAECIRCTATFHLVSLDSLGTSSYACPWCHSDLIENVRAHLYACAVLPAVIRQRAQEARDAARSLVKQSHQLRDNADVLIREAEAALYAFRASLRRAPARSATSAVTHSGRQIKLMAHHVFPRHLQVGDRFSDETGEWEVASRPSSTDDGKIIHTYVQRVDQPATVEDRTWIAHERICVKAPQRSLSA